MKKEVKVKTCWSKSGDGGTCYVKRYRRRKNVRRWQSAYLKVQAHLESKKMKEEEAANMELIEADAAEEVRRGSGVRRRAI